MAFFAITFNDIVRAFDLEKVDPTSFGLFHDGLIVSDLTYDGDLRVYVEGEGIPAGDVEIVADFKHHSDGSISLLRLGDVEVDDR